VFNFGSKIKESLSRTRNSVFGQISSLFGATQITDELWDDLEALLIQADVGVDTTTRLVEQVRERARREGATQTIQVEKILKPDAMVLLKGKLNGAADEPVIKIICDDICELKDAPGRMTEAIILRIDKDRLKPEDITYLKNTLFSHKGKIPVYFRVAVNGSDEISMVSKKVKISVNGSLLNELEKIISLDNMKVKVKLA